MKKTMILLFTFLMLSVQASDSPVSIDDAWLRAAPPNAHMLAAYASVSNNGDAPIHLIGADSDAFGMTEIHRTIEVDGVFKMKEQKRLNIGVGESLNMAPGGLHIMLMMPKQSFNIGEIVDIELQFEDSNGTNWSQSVSFEVKKEQ
jgi:hypothetical protein